ncbi:MAG: M28 family peptidase, partial [Ardenticatenaceae bacterium]|nr:M28 family peptidase [Ardenticatenaceae bacterium]
PITSHQQLATSLAQLLLANAGVTEAEAPWLWRGLAPAIAAEADFAVVQRANLPALQAAFAAEEFTRSPATDWAAVDYLQRQIGWEGLGQFILDVGEQGVAAALATAVNQTPAQFEAAWRGDWQSQLVRAETAVNVLLTARTEAIMSQNQTAFLNTIDSTVPYLPVEEGHWFDDLVQYPPLSWSLTGAPLVLYGDGRVLANVTLTYELSNLTGRRKGGSVQQEILFTSTENGLLWAGTPFATLSGEQVDILYPPDQLELAQQLLISADDLTTRLPDYLVTGLPDNPTTRPTIKLYPDDTSFRISIYPSLALADNLTGWVGPGESVKLRQNAAFTAEAYRSALAVLLGRQQVARLGVTDEWLLQGTAYYLAAQIDAQDRQIAAAGLHNLWLGIANKRIKSVTEVAERLALGDESTQTLATTQAWDAVRYLVETYGEAALLDVLRAQGRGQSLDEALQGAVGQSLAEFEVGWIESLGRAHAQPEWLATADLFDVALAETHLAALTAPELAGRQAGSPGAAMAADYIAEQFAVYGLEPVVALPPVVESTAVTETMPISETMAITSTAAITGTELLTTTSALSDVEVAVTPPELSYFQPFTIEYAALTAVPQLTIGEESFAYRHDFLTLLDELPGGGAAQGELIFVEDGTYTGLDVSGKIVIREAATAVPEEMAAAMEHGAAGLILVGESDYEKDFQMKRPLPVNFPDEPMIPTLLLTQIGLDHLLELAGMTRADLNNLPVALPLGLPVIMDIPLSQPEVVADAASATANVLGLLPGSDPDLRDEVIILSAHYDYVGDDPGGLAYSGANDNASGVAVMLAMAKLWQETGYQPARSILFAAWGAQEPGQIGSTAFISSTLFVPERTAGVVVLDAVGGGAGFRLLAQGNWERDGLLMFGMEQAGEVLDGRVRTGIPADQSDDVTFRAIGVPTILLTWTDASENNWPDAIADEINPDFLAITGRMTTLAVMSVAR